MLIFLFYISSKLTDNVIIVSTSFWVSATHKSWLKYTTYMLLKYEKYVTLSKHQYGTMPLKRPNLPNFRIFMQIKDTRWRKCVAKTDAQT